MGEGYRQQIVESEAQRLAREQEPYARAWRIVERCRRMGKRGVVAAAVAWVVTAVGMFGLGGEVALLGAGVFMGALATGFFTVFFYAWTRCPRCRGRLVGREQNHVLEFLYGSHCDHCLLKIGYLPTAEDLDGDGPGGGRRSLLAAISVRT